MTAALTAVIGCGKNQPPGPTYPSALHTLAVPDFDKRTLAGSKLDTKSLRGQVMVVKFFAEWCAPCKVTLPAAEQLHSKYDDVTFVGISLDERQADAAALVQRFGLSFPVIIDRSHALQGRFRVTELPMTFVVDGQGVVQWIAGPGHSEEELERAILAYR